MSTMNYAIFLHHVVFMLCRCDWHAIETKPPVVSEKAKSLGIDFTPFEVSLKDTVESLKEKNFLAF